MPILDRFAITKKGKLRQKAIKHMERYKECIKLANKHRELAHLYDEMAQGRKPNPNIDPPHFKSK